MIMTAKDRIQQYIEIKGISIYRLEADAGMSKGYWAKTKNISAEVLQKISRIYSDISPIWLLTGQGEMIKKQESEARFISPTIFTVPFVTKYGYAGYLRGYGDPEYVESMPTRAFMLDEDTTTPKGQYLSLEVKGDSMDDCTDKSIKDGDLLLCRVVDQSLYRDSKLHINQWIFVIVTTDGILVKKITAHDFERKIITIHSLNPMYRDEDINLEDVRMILNVVKLERKPVL